MRPNIYRTLAAILIVVVLHSLGVNPLISITALILLWAAGYEISRILAIRMLLEHRWETASKMIKMALRMITPLHAEDTRAKLFVFLGCSSLNADDDLEAEAAFTCALEIIESTRIRITDSLGHDAALMEGVRAKSDEMFRGAEAISTLEIASIYARTGRRKEALAQCHTSVEVLQEYRAGLVREMTHEEVAQKEETDEARWAFLLEDLPRQRRLFLLDRCLRDARELLDKLSD